MNKKLYAVKNDNGAYWDFGDLDRFWQLTNVSRPFTVSEDIAKNTVKYHGGHVVTLIEEPEKVVLSKEQAEIVERAHEAILPANYISGSGENECLLINAYGNGYTVENPKRYNVKVPHTDDSYFYKIDDEYCNAGDSYHLEGMTDKKWFTLAEIEHYGLQDCEKVDVKD